MRIATWNLDRCHPGMTARSGNLSAIMAGLDADLWVLTETYRNCTPADRPLEIRSSPNGPGGERE